MISIFLGMLYFMIQAAKLGIIVTVGKVLGDTAADLIKFCAAPIIGIAWRVQDTVRGILGGLFGRAANVAA